MEKDSSDDSISPNQRDYSIDLEIQKNLDCVGGAFFLTFGRLKEIQRKTIPIILQGKDTLIISETASGKTEAACAPLIKRNFMKKGCWTILYISPTKALVNDIYYRLLNPCKQLNLTLARRTGDHKENLKKIPNILITTPESFDSMLCRNKRQDLFGHDLSQVVAVILDEIHLLHGSTRGTQLKWLLHRLRKLREFSKNNGWCKDADIQIVALSATIANKKSVVDEYFPEMPCIIESSTNREIETISVESKNCGVKSVLIEYLNTFKMNEKILVFSNSRKRVEILTRLFKKSLEPFGFQVRAHYSNISTNAREDTEEAARTIDKIIIFSTSTLEIGIDIGDIDLIVLDGPPPDVSSLLQRIGRGNRRTGKTRVLACAETISDMLLQHAMIDAAREGWLGNSSFGPNYTVIRQQIASYVFQSPNKIRTIESIKSIFYENSIDPAMFIQILNKMVETEELIFERNKIMLGELWWKRAEEMGRIHSTIETQIGQNVTDIETGEQIAEGVLYKSGKGIAIGGKSLEIKKWHSLKLEVHPVINGEHIPGDWSYVSSKQFINPSRPQSLRRYLEIEENCWPLVRDNGYLFCFHLGGSLRYALLEIISSYYKGNDQIKINEYYIQFPEKTMEKPKWLYYFDSSKLKMFIRSNEEILKKIERILSRPKSNKTLPFEVRIEEVWQWLNFDAEGEAIKNANWKFLIDKDTENALKQFIIR